MAQEHAPLNEQNLKDEGTITTEFAVSISPRKVLYVLIGIALGFGLISGIGRLLRWFVVPWDSGLVPVILLFDVNLENNFPAYYSSILLLACAPLLAFIAYTTKQQNGRYVFHWWLLAWIFVFLSVDEMIELHGMLTEPVRAALGTSGFFYYAWVIPVAFLVLLIGLFYIRFLLHLPTRTRRLFILSAVIYVTGALVLEMAVGYIVTNIEGTRAYALATLEEHVEELMEMVGISLFIYTLLSYISIKYGGLFLKARIRES